MKIALVGSSLRPGGAERVMSSLANYWAEKHEPYLITVHGTEEDFYRLHPKVKRIGLDSAGVSRNPAAAAVANLRRVYRLRRVFRRHRVEVVISFHTRVNVLAIVAARLAGVPIVISERIDRLAFPESKTWRLLQSMTYRYAANLVLQTRSAREAFIGTVADSRITEIPNPLGDTSTSPLSAETASTVSGDYIVAVGRLVPQKGFDLLIDAFGKLAGRFPSLDLVIAGDGPQRSELAGRAAHLGLASRVHFTGVVANPHALVARAKLLVAPSRFEGFPNILLEAMSVGTPVVAADCRSGPAEIVRHGVDGLLVPPEDVPALVTAVESLLVNEELRARMAVAAREVRDRFGLETIAARWESVLSAARTG